MVRFARLIHRRVRAFRQTSSARHGYLLGAGLDGRRSDSLASAVMGACQINSCSRSGKTIKNSSLTQRKGS
jgi:hypothetical protein